MNATIVLGWLLGISGIFIISGGNIILGIMFLVFGIMLVLSGKYDEERKGKK